jgi:ribosome biogenesis GTPase
VRIENILPRKQILSRPDPNKKGLERVIAVNMDIIIITATIMQPRLNFKLIDRFMIAAQQTSAELVLLINKMDLKKKKHEKQLEMLDIYREMGVEVLLCSTLDSTGVDYLAKLTANKTCVFLGASGVGKSSLVNSLKPELELETYPNRESDGRGRHTTVMAEMFELANKARVIDTPGVREFNILDITPEELSWYFPEFEEYHDCRFSDCTHTHEDACGVKAAVLNGDISSHRHDSYVRILQTLDLSQFKRFANRNYDAKF